MKRVLAAVLGFVVGLGLLWFLFRGTSWSEVWAAVVHVRPLWFVLAWVPLLASFFLRVQRWSYIVRAVHPAATYRSLFSATQIGFLGNFTLPGRLGEVIRAVVLGRLTRMPVSQGLAAVTLDRVTDLVGLLVAMVIVLIGFRSSRDVSIPSVLFATERDILVPAGLVRSSAVGFSLLLALVIASLVVLYLNQGFVLRMLDRCLGVLSKRVSHWVHRLVEQFAQGLHVFRSWSDMTKSVSFSLLTWGCFMLSTGALCEAFRLDWPWYTPFVIHVALAVFISVPGTPGFIGQFQVPIVAALRMTIPDIDFGKALAFAVVIHLVNFIIVLAFGLVCLHREGFSLVELSRQSARARRLSSCEE